MALVVSKLPNIDPEILREALVVGKTIKNWFGSTDGRKFLKLIDPIIRYAIKRLGKKKGAVKQLVYLVVVEVRKASGWKFPPKLAKFEEGLLKGTIDLAVDLVFKGESIFPD